MCIFYAAAFSIVLLSVFPAVHARTILIEAESFENLSGWVVDQQFMDQMGSPFLLAHGLGQPVKDATTTVALPVKGRYRLWIRTRDWVAPWNAPGVPGKFQLLVDGEPLKTTFGTEGAEWHWQDGGTVEITSRQVTLSLHDLTGFGGRCDAIVLTSDMDFLPPNEGREMAEFRRKALGLPEKPEDAGEFDLVVVGGGIAGTCTAVSAARLGLQVALIQDRPVLGGNNSSEVRVHLGGKINLSPYPALGNIVKELDSGYHGNARPAQYYDDQKKLRVVQAEKNLSLFLNMHVYQVEKKGERIVVVIAKHIRSGNELRFATPLFADCTGDGIVGFLAGADYRMGRESRDQTGESMAPEKPDTMTLGTSVMWYSVETDEPTAFSECPWALQFNQETCQNATMGNWDWETGLHRDTITEAEHIRDHMLRAIYGNWAFQKNHSADKEKYARRKLAWVAYIAGKRESRRLLGDVILKQQDIQQQRKFPDAFVTTTWTIDLHYPQLKNAEQFDEPFRAIAEQKPIKPYPIPYRCLYSRNIENLFMAGRNISVTHVALGTVRVMRTGGMMGELVGMAASLCKKYGTTPRGVYKHHLAELKELAQRGVGKTNFLAEREAGSTQPSAYLSAGQLLDLYESMYSKIHNVHVIYTNMLEETKGDSPRLKRYTRFDTSEIIEEEGCEKYYRRWSSAPEGFEDPDGTIAEKAFNGSATSEYYPGTESGSINPGRTARAGDELNMLWSYMLLYRPQPYEKPDEPFIRRFLALGLSSMRPQLEQVSGEWCHVVDTFSRNQSKPYAIVWFAANKGGLPMKFERYNRGKCVRRILVTKVGSADIDTGKIWYPKQAIKESDDYHGYIRYEFQVKSLKVNIPTTPDMFRVSFPPGTDVIDHVAGTYYTIGPLGEKMRVGVLPDPLRKSKQEEPTGRMTLTDDADFEKALENGRLANEGFIRCRNFVKGWLKYADPATGLIPRNLNKDKDIWNAKDSAADNYPFMVLTAAITDRSFFEGRMLDMLRTETKLTSRIGAMPDTYSFSKQDFQNAEPEIGRIIFGSSEYIKDGLLPLTEWLGEGLWSQRMLSILDDIWKHAPIETKYGRIPSANQEVNGEMLQTLSRIYWMTGEKKYLDWAVRLGDYYLLDEYHPTKNQKRLSLDDHGCEIISGLCELYAMLHFIAPHKKRTYEKPIHKMLDRILQVGRDEHGLFYDWINPQTGQHADSLTDNWGYDLNGLYTVYLIDGTDSYRQAVRKALSNLNEHYKDYKWEGGGADGYADSIEGAINLYNREPVPSSVRWLDSVTRTMWDKQKPDGVIEGWHGDGNFARTTIMYCLWKTKGLTIRPWREDVIFGAVLDEGALKISIRADKEWKGRLIFDVPRHKTVMKMPIDWPRINQFPEWFTVDDDKSYTLYDVKSNSKTTYTGRQFHQGIAIDLQNRDERLLIVQ